MAEYVLTENGNIKVTDGRPTVKDGDKVYGVDAIGAAATITSLHAESAGHRKEAKEAKGALLKFGNIDPAEATSALELVASMGDDHKVEVENLKKEMNNTWQSKLAEKDTTIAGLEKQLFGATVTSKFATSEVVKSTVLPPDVAAAVFGSNFKPDGSATDSSGNPIYSKAKPGELAGFEEALQVLIDNYPSKNAILKGSGANGSGGQGGGRVQGGQEAGWFDKKSPEYSLTKQATLANTNPILYKQLKG